jgi:hypothetical protein
MREVKRIGKTENLAARTWFPFAAIDGRLANKHTTFTAFRHRRRLRRLKE